MENSEANKYDHSAIEKKWQKKWMESRIYEASDISDKPKYYPLVEFPYPSGAGLHVGHPRPYIGLDLIARKRRMEGCNVLYPIGWDAFGLPTENYAIKTGKDPAVITKENTDTFRRQIQSLGVSFDWSREINTTDPAYYKWTQWLFLQFYKHDLAYKAKMNINWCPKDKIGLANEEVIDGKCERCGTPVEKREKEQWMMAITKYADRLDRDLDTVDYSERIKTQQRNWIGRSEGAELEFKIKGTEEKIKIFTTRPDTLFGAFALILAPEHPLVEKFAENSPNKDELYRYIDISKKKTEIERTSEAKEKTGVEIAGVKAVNPVNGEEIPVWIADFVLAHYGSGAVFADTHDERDFAFAKKYDLPMRQVVMPDQLDEKNPPREGKENTERNTVHVILRNPKDNTVLVEFLKGEKWEGNDPRNFIIGGIEEGETPVETAIREIKEETGYANVKFVEQIPFIIQARFFANHKDVNRKITVHTLVFDLAGDERVAITEDEFFHKDSHDLAWVPHDKVAETVTIHDDQTAWKYFTTGGFAYEGEGILINSGKFDGMTTEKARKAVTEFAGGTMKTTYKLRDWVFSRQRYWGEPIPMIWCEKDKWVPVPEKDLPVVLPKVKDYQPTDSGDSPLASIDEWVNVTCPTCGGPAKRETDTMPNWAGSSWYYLRYTDPHNNNEFASAEKLKYWLGPSLIGGQSTLGGVDWYNGGMEHTTLHLLYSRFWHKFFFDIGLVFEPEPYKKRTSHGLIIAEDGDKMSKSRGNVVNPDDIVERFGADTLRLYEMFMGPFEQAIRWSTDNLIGSRRFIEKVWRLKDAIGDAPKDVPKHEMHKAIKKVGEDIESMSFNTAVSALMIYANALEKRGTIAAEEYETLLILLAPFAPHITEELWAILGHENSIHIELWPAYDAAFLESDEATIALQINGKVRGAFSAPRDAGEGDVKALAMATEEAKRWIGEGKIGRTIFVKNRLVNLIVEQ